MLWTRWFDEDPIKIEGTIDRTRSSMGIWHSLASNSEVNSPIWLEVELI